MILPDKIQTIDLKNTNVCYNADRIMDYEALYLGGDLFRDRICNFLVQRKSDKSYVDQWTERQKRSVYIDRAGGIIDWIAAAVFNDRPRYEVKPGASPAMKAYWEGLNQDSDGLGHPIADVLTRALINTLVHKRNYLQVKFNEEYGNANGGLDAYIDLMSPIEVTDWQHENGKLLWCRRDGAEFIRNENMPWLKPKDIRKTWTFYDANTVTTYEAIYINNVEPTEAIKIDEVNHDFGLPIFEVYAHPGHWILDRIYDVVVALYNRDSSVTKYLDDGAFQMFVLTLQDGKKMDSLTLSDIAGLKLEVGESAGWIAPQSGFYQSLQNDREYLKASLFETMQSTALNAASIPQAGRMSGETVKNIREPLQVLLNSLSYPIFDAWQRVTNSICRHRDEDPELVELKGFSDFGVKMEDMKEVIYGREEEGKGQGSSIPERQEGSDN